MARVSLHGGYNLKKKDIFSSGAFQRYYTMFFLNHDKRLQRRRSIKVRGIGCNLGMPRGPSLIEAMIG
ncbi:conserved hypothetical protein [Nitrosococcus watsonii C-113]|uniref:Uncharacterized protein n=1 Tax=Nitrosococcus watsoni (strain C-113) TaxID=105559 RepID=D8K5F9_NITWC|nr:conserved hypothetical protein [Nitrosococcus watsonii C-113]